MFRSSPREVFILKHWAISPGSLPSVFLRLLSSSSVISSFLKQLLFYCLWVVHMHFLVTDICCCKLTILQLRTSLWVLIDLGKPLSRPHFAALKLCNLGWLKDPQSMQPLSPQSKERGQILCCWISTTMFFQLWQTRLGLILANELQAAVACCPWRGLWKPACALAALICLDIAIMEATCWACISLSPWLSHRNSSHHKIKK